MDYRLDVETVTLRTALLEFLRARMPDPGAEPNADHRRRAWRELVASEWLEHYAAAVGDGSTPADHVGALHVVEAFGAAPVTGPVDVVAGYLLPLAERIGWTAPRERLRSGAVVTAVVPVLDLRSRGPRLAATRTRDRVTVTSVLPRVSCAAEADALVVALDLEGRPALGIVDLRGRGVTVGAPSGVDLRRPVAEVDLDAADMDPAEVSGTAELLEQEDLAVLGHSLFLDAESVGGASEVIARSVRYCSERVQFGRPVGSFQAVRHRLADAAARAEGARSLAYRTAWDLAQAEPAARTDVVASRLWSSDSYVAAAEAAVQCHGGMGFTWEQGVHVFYRAALAGRGESGGAGARAVVRAHLSDLAGAR